MTRKQYVKHLNLHVNNLNMDKRKPKKYLIFKSN